MDGSERYHVKRAAGISAVRKDGRVADPENDRQAAEAERFAAQAMGCPFDDSIGVSGDRGIDFVYALTIEVVWLGRDPSGRPRQGGHLIMNPNEPQRWGDIYVVVKGGIEEGFEIVGWMPHTQLVKQPLKDFGYGMKYAAPVAKLHSMGWLKMLKREAP